MKQVSDWPVYSDDKAEGQRCFICPESHSQAAEQGLTAHLPDSKTKFLITVVRYLLKCSWLPLELQARTTLQCRAGRRGGGANKAGRWLAETEPPSN